MYEDHTGFGGGSGSLPNPKSPESEPEYRRRLDRERHALGGVGGAVTECATAVEREPTARHLLQMLINEFESERDGLHALVRALPQELPYQADRALRNLITAARRGIR